MCGHFDILQLEVWEELDLEALEVDLKTVLEQGIRSLAVVLLHAYMSELHKCPRARLTLLVYCVCF